MILNIVIIAICVVFVAVMFGGAFYDYRIARIQKSLGHNPSHLLKLHLQHEALPRMERVATERILEKRYYEDLRRQIFGYTF